MRKEILCAALQAFVKHGFHNTSMIKIANKMGIAKGTLYLYFESKEQLIEMIAEHYFERLRSNLIPKKIFETPRTLIGYIEKSLLINDDESKFIPIFFEVFGPSFSSDEFVEKYDKFFKEIATFYKENLKVLLDKELINKDIDPKYFSRALVSLLDGIILHKGFFKIKNTYYRKIVQEMIKILERSLKL